MSAQHPICLVVDVSCDLPEQYRGLADLKFLPTRIVIGETTLLDTREPDQTKVFFGTNLALPSAVEGHSEPLKIEEMAKAFQEHLALQFDNALGVFVASSRSAIYGKAKEAMSMARMQAYRLRAQAGNATPLQVDCVDSQALFAGYAAQVIDMLDGMWRGESLTQLIERQSKIVSQTYTYLAPGNVDYILKRASLKGEQSVSALAGFAAKTLSITPILSAYMGKTAPVGRKLGRVKAREAILDMAHKALEQKLLLSPHLCLSYSGLLSDILEMPSFAALKEKAEKSQVRLHLAQMSMTGSVNVGPDALSLGILAKPHLASDLL